MAGEDTNIVEVFTVDDEVEKEGGLSHGRREEAGRREGLWSHE